MAPRNKTPRYIQQATAAKTVRVGTDPDSWRTESPAWSYRMVVLGGPYGWSDVDAATYTMILQKLEGFSSMNWQDVINAGSHEIPVNEIEDDRVSGELRRIGLGDVDRLMSLRITGPMRVWGYRQGRTVSILFLDRLHQFCPSKLRHT